MPSENHLRCNDVLDTGIQNSPDTYTGIDSVASSDGDRGVHDGKLAIGVHSADGIVPYRHDLYTCMEVPDRNLDASCIPADASSDGVDCNH